MKNFTIAFILTVFFCISTHAQVNLEEGLVAHYSFSGSTDNSADSIFNGTLQNGAGFTKDRLGVENQSGHFDGENDFVQFNPDSSIITTSCFTISAWARMEGEGGGTSNQNTIFQQRAELTGNTSTIVFSADNGLGQAALAVRGYGSTTNNANAPKMDYGTWHHYVGLVDGDSVKLYLDNELVQSIAFTTDTNFTQNIGYVDIGRHRYYYETRGYFNGDIDEVRFYNRALNEEEIGALYFETLRAGFHTNTTVAIANEPVNFTDNSFADNTITSWQWDFNNDGTIDSEEQNPQFTYDSLGVYDVKLIVNDGSYVDSIIKYNYVQVYDVNDSILRYYNLDNNLDDLSGNNISATVEDSSFAHRNGMANICYATDENYEVEAPAIGNWGDHLAISVWFYGSVKETTQAVFASRQNGTGATLTNLGCLLQPDSTIRFFVASDAPDEPNTYSSGKILPNQWNHVVCIQNREINKNIVVLNGVADSVTYTQTPRYKNYPIGFGGWNSGFNNNAGLVGRVDEIRIYNRELSWEEIDYLYNQEFEINADNDILAEYNFMGNADDITGNGFNGTANNAELAEDRFDNARNAYQFNSAQESYIDLGSELKPAQFPVFVSTWINHDVISGEQVIFRNDDWDSTSVYAGIVVKSIDGKIAAAYGDSAGNTENNFYQKTTDDVVIEPNEWYHVVVGFINEDNIEIYINNAMVEGVYSGTITTLQYKNGNAAIGVGSSMQSGFNGRIDDCRVYNRYIDVAEIDVLYNYPDQCPSYNVDVEIEICEGENYIFGTQTLTESGEYMETFETVLGCDSVVNLTLIVNPVYFETETVEICNGDVYTWNGSEYSQPGTYVNTYWTVSGCDSIQELNLTVHTVDVSVSVDEYTLTANSEGIYQWIDCITNQPLSGETNQSFTATENGNYAVIIDDGSCVDTSECYTISGIGIDERNNFSAHIYPNPTNGIVEVDLTGNNVIKMSITNMFGEKMMERVPSGQIEKIDLSNFKNGVYIISIETETSLFTSKIIKR